MTGPVRAVLWDFDNTLVDSRERNLAVTRRIVERLVGRWDEIAMLQTLESYEAAIHRTTNWRALYQREFGLAEEAIDAAGLMWTEYQENDETELPLYEGVVGTLDRLSHLPHGIVSQNCRRNIRRALGHNGLQDRFRVVIGYEEVHLRSQKPAPDGILMCAERLMALEPGVLVYVGDHETDVECAANAESALASEGRRIRVVSIGADYGRGDGGEGWARSPDHRASAVPDVAAIVELLDAS